MSGRKGESGLGGRERESQARALLRRGRSRPSSSSSRLEPLNPTRLGFQFQSYLGSSRQWAITLLPSLLSVSSVSSYCVIVSRTLQPRPHTRSRPLEGLRERSGRERANCAVSGVTSLGLVGQASTLGWEDGPDPGFTYRYSSQETGSENRGRGLVSPLAWGRGTERDSSLWYLRK